VKSKRMINGKEKVVKHIMLNPGHQYALGQDDECIFIAQEAHDVEAIKSMVSRSPVHYRFMYLNLIFGRSMRSTSVQNTTFLPKITSIVSSDRTFVKMLSVMAHWYARSCWVIHSHLIVIIHHLSAFFCKSRSHLLNPA
jgi:hypothetical protein